MRVASIGGMRPFINMPRLGSNSSPKPSPRAWVWASTQAQVQGQHGQAQGITWGGLGSGRWLAWGSSPSQTGLGSNSGPHPSSMGEPKVEERERLPAWNESPGVAPTSSLDAAPATEPAPAPAPTSAHACASANVRQHQRPSTPAPAPACVHRARASARLRLHLRPWLRVLSGMQTSTEWRAMIFTMAGHWEHGKTANRAQKLWEPNELLQTSFHMSIHEFRWRWVKHNASHGSEGKQNSHMMYSKDKTELCYLQITPKENKRDNNNKPIKAKHKSSNPHKILRKERKKSSLLIEEKPKINGSHTFTFFPLKKSPLSRLPLSRVPPPLENPSHLPIPPMVQSRGIGQWLGGSRGVSV